MGEEVERERCSAKGYEDWVRGNCSWFEKEYKDLIRSVMVTDNNEDIVVPEPFANNGAFFKVYPDGLTYDTVCSDSLRVTERILDFEDVYPPLGACRFSPELILEGFGQDEVEEILEDLIFDIMMNRSLTLTISKEFKGMNLGVWAMRVPTEELREAYIKVVQKVKELEDRGVLHGDVHPLNVMINGDRIALVDFDVSGLIDEPSTLVRVPESLPYAPTIIVEDPLIKDFISLVFMPPELLAFNDKHFSKEYKRVQLPQELLSFEDRLREVFGENYVRVLKKVLEGWAPKERPVSALLRDLNS